VTSLTAHRQPVLLLAGLTAAVAVRVGAGDPAPGGSLPAALLFAAVLAVLAVAAGVPRPALHAGTARWAVLGAVVLCAPALTRFDPAVARDGFWSWACAVTVVVLAEEAFLRGALFGAVAASAGDHVAVLVTAVAFAGLHVPLYGWHVLPLDFAVGLLLGALRLASGSWAAPAGAHAVADYVGWFCR
jgi:membrane protease YdiL (CAAX protease family)